MIKVMIKNPVCIKQMKQEIITFLKYVFIISILQKKIKTVWEEPINTGRD